MKFSGFGAAINFPLDLQLNGDKPDLLKCSMCSFTTPCLNCADCGHVLCENCCVIINSKTSCLVCKIPVSTYQVKIPVEYIRELEFCCSCGETGNIATIREHVLHCEFPSHPPNRQNDENTFTPLNISHDETLDRYSESSCETFSSNIQTECHSAHVSSYLEYDSNSSLIDRSIETMEKSITDIQRTLDKHGLRDDHGLTAKIERISRRVIKEHTRSDQQIADVVRSEISSAWNTTYFWIPLRDAICRFRSTDRTKQMTEGIVHRIGGYKFKIMASVSVFNGVPSIGIFLEPRTTISSHQDLQWPMRHNVVVKLYNVSKEIIRQASFSTFDVEANEPKDDMFVQPLDNDVGWGFNGFIDVDTLIQSKALTSSGDAKLAVELLPIN